MTGQTIAGQETSVTREAVAVSKVLVARDHPAVEIQMAQEDPKGEALIPEDLREEDLEITSGRL